jgi:RNA polymerase sigma-70 factor, ECF subfamily
METFQPPARVSPSREGLWRVPQDLEQGSQMSASPPPGHAASSDADLVRAVARQDRQAFIELFGRYAGRIKGFAMRGGASALDADEIAQDVMVAVWRRAADFDPARAGVATWIFAIARNRRIDALRRGRRAEPDPRDPLFQPDPEPDGITVVTAAEREARVRAGVAALSPEQRQVLIAAFYEGLSHGDIARRFALPLGTVKSRLRLAFRHLRGALDATDGRRENDG